MSIQTVIKEKIISHLLELLLGLSTIPIAILIFVIEKLVPIKLIEEIGSLMWLKLSLFLLLVCLGLTAYIIYLRSKYKFYPELGVEGDISKNILICPVCKNKLRVENDGWYCIKCDKHIPTPSKDTLKFNKEKEGRS